LIINSSVLITCSCLLLQSVPVHAALHDRGGGLFYDDVLDVTWLQDAAYQVTSNAPNVDTNGKMTWQNAMNWATSLVYHDSVRNVDWDDWRLPTVSPVNGTTLNIAYSFDGSTDNGYNITNPASELSYMYYINLAGVSLVDTNGNFRPGQQGIADPSPFTGISGAVWTQTDHPADSSQAFVVGMGNGHQNWFSKSDVNSVWAVRNGDVDIPHDGDLNADGLVNVADLLFGYRVLSGKITLTTEQSLHGDVAPLVDGKPAPDGKFSIGDLLAIQRKIFGLAAFP
jgi:hypothetical protein